MSTSNHVFYKTVSSSALISTLHITLSPSPEEFKLLRQLWYLAGQTTFQSVLVLDFALQWHSLHSIETSIFLSIPHTNSKKSRLDVLRFLNFIY